MHRRLQYPSSFPRKREPRAAASSLALDPRFRGGDDKLWVLSNSFPLKTLMPRFHLASRFIDEFKRRLEFGKSGKAGIARRDYRVADRPGNAETVPADAAIVRRRIDRGDIVKQRRLGAQCQETVGAA